MQTARKMTDRQYVLKCARVLGMTVSPRKILFLDRQPKPWLWCFDTWAEARDYLNACHAAFVDAGKPYPWA